MNKKENQKRLKQLMATLKMKIENLKPHIESSDRLNNMYNKLVIEKAIVKQELENLSKRKPSFFEKLTKYIRPKNKKLISDYFHS